MLQRLSEVAYNSYRSYLRRRRDPVRELFGESVPVALEEPRRARLAVRRAVAAVVTATVVGGAVWGGDAVLEYRQDEDARLDQRYWHTVARADALEDAYASVYAEEMRDRGLSEQRIAEAQWASLEAVTSGEPETDGIPPQHSATLAVERQLEDALALRQKLWDQKISD